MRTLRVAALLTGVALALAPAVAGAADPLEDGAQVSHVEPAGDGAVSLLVSVPTSARVDLTDVGVTFDGDAATSVTAERAGTAGTLRRTAILAIDTSQSMAGARFVAAKRAAFTFLDEVPDDVYVGVVTFAGEVVRLVEPGLDREAATDALSEVELSKETRLYDGVAESLAMAGEEGQRSVLVLSDGADTSETSLDDTAEAVTDSEARVDVVALDQQPDDLAALERLATAGAGEVLPADDAALRKVFADQAEVLARQIQVTAQLPAELDATEATVEVTLQTDEGPLVAEAFAPVQDESVTAPRAEAAPVLPAWSLFAGIGALVVGAAGLFVVLFVPTRARAATLEERVAQYATYGGPTAPLKEDSNSPALPTLRDAAAEVLKRNQSLEERLDHDLAAAGSQLKPTEWLLVWVGVFLSAGLLGLVLGRGSVLLGMVFLAIGALGPWLYLKLRRARRLKAFDASLPDTLQLLAGSLQAGLSLSQGVDTVVREGQEPIASEFKRVLVETRLGIGLEDAFQNLADRFGSKDFSWVVMAIRIQREVGGNLAELLGTVAATMREREFLRRQVAALSAEGKISALVLGVLPPAFLLYLMVAQRSYVMPLFTDMRGLIMLVGGGLWLGVGVFWMSKLVKVEA